MPIGHSRKHWCEVNEEGGKQVLFTKVIFNFQVLKIKDSMHVSHANLYTIDFNFPTLTVNLDSISAFLVQIKIKYRPLKFIKRHKKLCVIQVPLMQTPHKAM